MSPRQSYAAGIGRIVLALVAAWFSWLAHDADLPGLVLLGNLATAGLLVNGWVLVIKGAKLDNEDVAAARSNAPGGSPTEPGQIEQLSGPGATHSPSGLPGTQTGVAALYGRLRASTGWGAR